MVTKEEEVMKTWKVKESSMDVASLNNLVVSMRPLFKKAKVHAIGGITRQMQKYAKRKGNEKQAAVYRKRSQNMLEEIAALKMLISDHAIKFALANELPFEKLAAEKDSGKKALGRIATHPAILKKVQKWRNEHDDWKALAAFMLSKNTGRRFKKKKKVTASERNTESEFTKAKPIQKCSLVAQEKNRIESKTENKRQVAKRLCELSKTPAAITKHNVVQSKNLRKQCDRETDREVEHSDSGESGGVRESIQDIVENAHVEERDGMEKIDSREGQIKMAKTNKERVSSTSVENVSNTNKEMVIKKLSLNDLSGDEDIPVTSDPSGKSISFLFQSNSPVKKKVKDAFFLDSSSEADNESNSDSGEDNTEENLSEKEEESFFVETKVKNLKRHMESTFIETLSAKDHKQKRNFHEMKGKDRPTRHERNKKSYVEKSRNQDRGFNHHEVSQTSERDINKMRKEKTSWKHESTHLSRSAGQKDFKKLQSTEKLHPSWEASRKRKLETSTIVAFQGKKITFDDD